MKIENCWRVLKATFKNLKNNSHPRRIEEILNSFSLKSLVKTYKVYEFTLRRLQDYHKYSLEKYFRSQPEGESFIPNFEKIDAINDIIRERGYLWRTTEEME